MRAVLGYASAEASRRSGGLRLRLRAGATVGGSGVGARGESQGEGQGEGQGVVARGQRGRARVRGRALTVRDDHRRGSEDLRALVVACSGGRRGHAVGGEVTRCEVHNARAACTMRETV
eukprot:967458-Prymnesium_polylepis.1